MSVSTAERLSHVVVGGGLCGLTAAAALSRRGGAVTLLESTSVIGGLSRSFTMDGIVFDLGPHMLMINPHGRWGVYIRGLLEGRSILRRRYMFGIRAAGRMWRFPMSPAEFLRSPSWARRDLLRCLVRRAEGWKPVATVRDYLTSWTGERHYGLVFEPLAAKKLGTSGSALHEDWILRPHKNVYTSRDFSMENPHPVPRNALNMLAAALHEAFPMYVYPERGMGDLAECLRERFTGELHTSCGPLRLEAEGRRITGVSFSGGDVPVDSLVWTAPTEDLYRSLGELPPPGGRSVATRMVFLTFRSDTPPRRPFLYTYHLDGETLFHRVYYPRSIYREATPGGIEGLCFEIRLTEAVEAMSEGSLVDTVVSDAIRIGVAFGHPHSVQVLDVLHASPLLGPDYKEREGELFRVVSRFDNLAMAGRQGNHCNCMMTGAVAQGLLAADRVMEQHAPA